jgi:hypothetical protein
VLDRRSSLGPRNLVSIKQLTRWPGHIIYLINAILVQGEIWRIDLFRKMCVRPLADFFNFNFRSQQRSKPPSPPSPLPSSSSPPSPPSRRSSPPPPSLTSFHQAATSTLANHLASQSNDGGTYIRTLVPVQAYHYCTNAT